MTQDRNPSAGGDSSAAGQYHWTAAGPPAAPPEVALAGRSNVGKSSLLNMIAGRRLARSGKTPGVTRRVNVYQLPDLNLVDLPGYGYARASKTRRELWGREIERYLLGSKDLRLVICLVDSRHPPSELDITLRDWLSHRNLPFAVTATKADKVSRGGRQAAERTIRETLSLGEEVPLIFTSTVTGEGREELWRLIQEAAAAPRQVPTRLPQPPGVSPSPPLES
ncbi:MAG: YihA family ribosome biogenesis GTP-binding protein [Firmicutes bacterium]|nr:YihA family ribosome biogenesis GTP-binding protein [Bacillota bacterium]